VHLRIGKECCPQIESNPVLGGSPLGGTHLPLKVYLYVDKESL
jgi:hypothetical protein